MKYIRDSKFSPKVAADDAAADKCSDDASSLLGVYSTVEVHGYIVAFCRGFSFRGRTGTDYISHPSGDDEIRPGEKIAVRESLTATASWFHRQVTRKLATRCRQRSSDGN